MMIPRFLSNIRRRRADTPLLLTQRLCDKPYLDEPQPGDTDPSELGDTSYEDALLDMQLRRFMHAEFDGVQAPEGSLRKVLVAIAAIESDRRSKRAVGEAVDLLLPVRRVTQAFYRAATKPGMASVVSGGLAFALILMVMGNDISAHLAGGSQYRYLLTSTPVTSVTSESAFAEIKAMQAEARSSTYLIVEASDTATGSWYDVPQASRSQRAPASYASSSPQQPVPRPGEMFPY